MMTWGLSVRQVVLAGNDIGPVEIGILAVGHQLHVLLVAVGAEMHLVGHEEGLGGVLPLSPSMARTSTSRLSLPRMVTPAADGAGVAVDNQGVSAAGRAGQADIRFHGAAVAVVHPQALGHGFDGGKHRVEQHRVGRKFQAAGGLHQVFLGLAAGQEGEQAAQKEKQREEVAHRGASGSQAPLLIQGGDVAAKRAAGVVVGVERCRNDSEMRKVCAQVMP